MRAWLLLLAAVAPLSAQELRSPVHINLDLSITAPDAGIVSCQPAFDVGEDGPITFAWTAFRNGRERILSSTVRGGRPSAQTELSPGEGVYYQPVVVSTGPASAWAVWMRLVGRRWQLLARRQNLGIWDPVQALTPETVNALRPAALAMGPRAFLAWEEGDGPHSRITARQWDGSAWSAAAPLSEAEAPAYRPTLAAAGDGSVWAFWDSYREGEYAVFGRRIHPTPGKIERVSGGGKSCLKPAAGFGGKTGLVVAWLARTDVTGAGGVLDQHFTLQAAVRREGRWAMLTDDAGRHEIADLRHGLLPVIEPKVGGLLGYQGRRRHPMLIEDQGTVWLLWERRIVHDGTGDTAGELCGRSFDGRRWSEPVSLHQGLLDYRVSAGGRARDGSLVVAAKGLHLYYTATQIDLARGRPFRFDDRWGGWTPVSLPLRPDPPRSSIEIEGRKHHLYWADLHVHSGLTPDAEGEVDELMHFARDKARLDVVVIQENDFLGRKLTEGEYRLSVHLSRRFTEPARFVALPAFEWTERSRSHRNHRTVMYAGEETPILRYTDDGNDIEALCDAVEAAGGVMNTQHERYGLLRRPCDANIEVASGWRVFINQPGKIHRDLSDGYEVGFVATSDGHRRNPGTGGGLTGIYAKELTPAAVLEAIRDHRVYATNGARPVIDARANGVFMGRAVESAGDVRLRLEVSSPRPIVRAVLVRDGEEIHSVGGDNRTVLRCERTDRPGTGFHWYYWRIELDGQSPDYPANIKVAEGHLAWTSPHRVSVR